MWSPLRRSEHENVVRTVPAEADGSGKARSSCGKDDEQEGDYAVQNDPDRNGNRTDTRSKRPPETSFPKKSTEQPYEDGTIPNSTVRPTRSTCFVREEQPRAVQARHSEEQKPADVDEESGAPVFIERLRRIEFIRNPPLLNCTQNAIT